MCCRYCMELSPELRPYIEAANRSPLKEKLEAGLGRPLRVQGEVRPTDLVPVLASSRSAAPAVFPMLWGFSVPGRRPSLFNARVETAPEKPAFRDSWARHRCVVPAFGYYEWEHLTHPVTGKPVTGDRYRIRPMDGSTLWMAGLYRMENREGLSVPVFTILTREPGASLRFLHDRMPLILPQELIHAWIHPSSDPRSIALRAVTDMAVEKQAGKDEAVPSPESWSD